MIKTNKKIKNLAYCRWQKNQHKNRIEGFLCVFLTRWCLFAGQHSLVACEDTEQLRYAQLDDLEVPSNSIRSMILSLNKLLSEQKTLNPPKSKPVSNTLGMLEKVSKLLSASNSSMRLLSRISSCQSGLGFCSSVLPHLTTWRLSITMWQTKKKKSI